MQRYSTFLPGTVMVLVSLFLVKKTTEPKIPPLISNCKLYIANVFSPNGDGSNDLFLPQMSPNCRLTDYELIIMDRWGGILFQTNNINNGWNGEYEGQPMEEGLYVYNIEYAFSVESDSTNKASLALEHGEINLVR